jgi:methyl-accepting chemotaxis protein
LAGLSWQGASESSTEQANMLKQIEQGIEQISSVVQSNSAAAEETSATSQELSAQSEGLKNLVGRFKLAE